MAEMIKILFLPANPMETSPLRLGQEIRDIDEMLHAGSARDLFQLVQHSAVRADDLQKILLRHQPHIVHFSSYGSSAKEIILMDASGTSHPVNNQTLANLFHPLRDSIRIIVLSSCYSKQQAEAISRNIDYTVGTEKSIGDRAATTFAAAFYRALSFGRSVNDAVELGKSRLDLENHPRANSPELLLREGVDPTGSFSLHLRQDYVDDLTTALSHLVSGAASDAEAQAVRRAISAGKIILKADEVSVKHPKGRLRVTPHRSFVDIGTDDETLKHLQNQLYPSPPGIVPQLPGLVFIGREDSLREVKDLIGVNQTSPPANSLTVVRGWPGVGKTTLMGVISRDQEVCKAFPDGVLWASLSFGEDNVSQAEHEQKLLSLMAAWARALGSNDLLRVSTLNEATTQLAALLRHKRMLLIIDDVWKQGHALPFLQASGGLCAVLVTTRLPKVARELTGARGVVYTLPVLTEEDALLLLNVLVPAIVEQHQGECRELVRDLEYLPLALHVAAGRLRTEAELGLDVADLIKGVREDPIEATAPIDRAESETRPTLAALLHRSTKGLDERERECFAFLGAFAPKPATFDLDAMAAVWQVSDPKLMVGKLVGQGLLEPVGSGRFQMHALLVQHARSLLSK